MSEVEKEDRILYEALTFDDVLLVPARSSVLPKEVNLHTKLSRNIPLSIPLVSAAMDKVTGSEMAIQMARMGGVGILHRNQAIEEQIAEVGRVKRAESGIIQDPVTIEPDKTVRDAFMLMQEHRISGIPVVEGEELKGIVTLRDLRFETNFSQPISGVMTTGEKLITAPVGTSFEEAEKILQQKRIEKLPIVDKDGRLGGLVTVKDIQKRRQFPDACKDDRGRLLVGAAIGVASDALERAEALIMKQVDLLVVDSAHGHSEGVLNLVKVLKNKFPEKEIIAGNVVTPEGVEELIECGADAVKVGIGPGASCTTRVVTGVGVPQMSAIMKCAKAASKHGVPIVADGGVRYSGDIAKAIAAGAASVMLGSLFAGMEESPGEMILLDGRWFKTYRGMGSIGAMQTGGGDRYFQEGEDIAKMVPEGIEGRVPYRGPVRDSIHQLTGGLRAAMGYCGTPDIGTFQRETKFVRITDAGVKESHPHDMVISREAPNYQAKMIE